MQEKEIKRGDVHCFTNCGYNCKALVREQLEAHYAPIAAALGKGWEVRIHHNGGWHGNLYNAEAQFYLSDRAVRGGQTVMRLDADRFDENRFECFNYERPDGTTQIWVYGNDPKDAIRNAFNAAAERTLAYMVLQAKILDVFPG